MARKMEFKTAKRDQVYIKAVITGPKQAGKRRQPCAGVLCQGSRAFRNGPGRGGNTLCNRNGGGEPVGLYAVLQQSAPVHDYTGIPDGGVECSKRDHRCTERDVSVRQGNWGQVCAGD